jgi:hypothetical protein
MFLNTTGLCTISPFLLGSAGLCGYGGGTSDSYGIASFLGLKLAFRGLNGLSFHNPGAFWALLSLPWGHLRSNTLPKPPRYADLEDMRGGTPIRLAKLPAEIPHGESRG